MSGMEWKRAWPESHAHAWVDVFGDVDDGVHCPGSGGPFSEGWTGETRAKLEVFIGRLELNV